MKKLVFAIMLICLVAYPVFAMGGRNQAPVDPDANRKSIYVNTDTDYNEMLKKAIKLTKDEKYDLAITMLQSILKIKDISDYCYAPDEEGDLFLGLQEICKKMLIEIPPESKQNLIFEQNTIGVNLLKQYKETKDIKFLLQIIDDCYLSEHLDTAIAILAEKNLEEGRPSRAIYLISRLTDAYRKKLNEQHIVILLVAYSMRAEKEALAQTIKNIPNELQEKEVSFANQKSLLKDFVKVVQGGQFNFPAMNEEVHQTTPVMIGKMQWDQPLHVLNQGGFGKNRRLKGTPLLYKDKLLTNQAVEVVGYNIKDGKAELKDISLIDEKATRSLSYPQSMRTALLKGNTLYVSLISGYRDFNPRSGGMGGMGNMSGRPSKYNLLTTEMIAYDLAHKKIKWSLIESNKDNEEHKKFFESTITTSKPTIIDDIMFFETLTQNNFPESYVVAVNPENGKLIWKTLVSAKSGILANVGMMGRGYNIPILRGNTGMLRSGRYLYFSHAYGIMGALDADSGDIIWLRRFGPLQKKMAARGGGMGAALARQRNKNKKENSIMTSDEPGWIPNKCTLLDENTVLFAPQKCATIFLLNSKTGDMLQRVKFGDENSIQILGIDKDKIYVYDRRVVEINWKKKTTAEWGFYGKAAGQGAIINDYLYLPLMHDKMVVVSIDTKFVVQDVKVDKPGLMGNLMIQNNQIVMMGLENISLWTTAKLDPNANKNEFVEYVNAPDLSDEENAARKMINDLSNPDVAVRTATFKTLWEKATENEKYLKDALNHKNLEIRVAVEWLLHAVQKAPVQDAPKKGGMGSGRMGGMGGMKGMGK